MDDATFALCNKAHAALVVVPPEPAPGNDPFKPEEWAPVVLSGPPPTLTPAESDLLAQMGSHVLAPVVARYAMPEPTPRLCRPEQTERK